MPDFETFKEELREALTNLHNPQYQPPEQLCEMLKCDPLQGSASIQAVIHEAIEALKPEGDVAGDNPLLRSYDSLRLRYILRQNQEESADRLHLSVRHLQRIQSEAIHRLAMHLWQEKTNQEVSVQAEDWRTQAKLEFTSLKESSPNVNAQIGEVVESVLALNEAMMSIHHVQLETGVIQPDLQALVHPAILRQTLIAAVGRLAPHLSEQKLQIYATLENGMVKLTLTGSCRQKEMIDAAAITKDIIAPPEFELELLQRNERIFLNIHTPPVDKKVVLVIEDNADMVYFYRRCTTRTTYQIVHLEPDDNVFEKIEKTSPDIIVLDVMLPDIDGWQLLTYLHERPSTRSIPVIICSVVKEESLAKELGAADFLAKPFQPQRFVQALDQALIRGSGAFAKGPANNAGTF